MRVSVFSWAELKVAQKNGAIGRALPGKVGGGRGLSLSEDPTEIPAGEKKDAVFFCSLWRACVLDFNPFPEDMGRAHTLESVSCHLSPNLQAPFRTL